ncbi:cytochrome c biogenesis CcdA family protein [Halonatronum saccharophilum]|uniref:cytochrome c biogenesis CcdA family protein n=1 Tax=Halonatronum saccharophilum TaxID=150060 RepID=UPI000480D017|nr:cytochrome c biogenesis CcdA family protein [Halonatronum saccharophilum]
MGEVSLVVAFFAGLISFLSPCVLPLVPAYVGYINGGAKQRTNLFTLIRSLSFVLGFSIVFILMGASASYLGQLFAYHRQLLTKISGILIIIFGFHMLGVFKINFLYREFRFNWAQKAKSSFSSILMGMAFAAGWTPCVGTVLASILLYAGSTATIGRGIVLLAFYSLGLGIPFIMTALYVNKSLSLSSDYNKYLPLITKFSGFIMIIFGVLIYFDKIQRIIQFSIFNYINW